MAGAAPRESSPPKFDVGAAYDAHADFVWRTLHRLGVETRDLPDLTQDVFAVVVRRKDEFAAERSVRPWLYGICVRLVRNYRRRAFRQREHLRERLPEAGAEASISQRAKQERAARLLASIDPEKRAVFVMFEVEGLSGQAIAESLGVPIGTVHSRLHAARRELLAALQHEEEIEP